MPPSSPSSRPPTRSSRAAASRCSSTSADDTLNLDDAPVEAAITPRTRAIVAVHYAGVACEMDALGEIAGQPRAHADRGRRARRSRRYRGRPLGTIGDLGTLSFHETKNVMLRRGRRAADQSRRAGVDRAEIMHEKGTNRRASSAARSTSTRGSTSGSSFPPRRAHRGVPAGRSSRTAERSPRSRLRDLGRLPRRRSPHSRPRRSLRRPVVPADCEHNAHLYYLLLAGRARPRRADRRRSTSAASTRCSTTCRCTPRRPASGSAGRGQLT